MTHCRISAAAVDVMRRHLTAAYPREGCGLLVGWDDGEERTIQAAVPARNDEPDPHRYTIAPEDFLRAEKAARARGLEVVGFYHSHPDHDPTPSEHDVAQGWSHYSYVIVGVHGGECRSVAAWRCGGGGFVPQPLHVLAPQEQSS